MVTVSSGFHRTVGTIDLDDLNWARRRYRRWAAYSQSKLANLLFALELQRRLTAGRLAGQAVAAHPGTRPPTCRATWAAPSPMLAGAIANRLLAQSAEMGALPTLYAATADLPGGGLVGPGGFQRLRGHPALEWPRAPPATPTSPAGCGTSPRR